LCICGWNVDSQQAIEAISNPLNRCGSTTSPRKEACLVEVRMTTRTHALWQSIRNREKNRPSYSEQLARKGCRILDMVKDLETDDNIVTLIGRPGLEVRVEEANAGGLGDSLTVQTGSGQGGRERGEKGRLTASDIKNRGRLEAHQKVLGHLVVATRPIRGIEVRQWH
jgi:hypothetical protein